MSARCPTAERNGRPCVLACSICRPVAAAAAAPIVGDEVHAQDVVCHALFNETSPGAYARVRFGRLFDKERFTIVMPQATARTLVIGNTYRLTIAPVTLPKDGDS